MTNHETKTYSVYDSYKIKCIEGTSLNLLTCVFQTSHLILTVNICVVILAQCFCGNVQICSFNIILSYKQSVDDYTDASFTELTNKCFKNTKHDCQLKMSQI